jgi:DNA-binding beta-propeller fold protein YncE
LTGRGRRLAAAVAFAALLGGAVAGCSTGSQAADDLQVAANLVAATAAISPPPSISPVGTVLPLSRSTTAVVIDTGTRTLVAAVDNPPALLLYPLADLDNPQVTPWSVPLPGVVNHLSLVRPGGPVLAPVPSANQVVEIAIPTATTTAVVTVPGGPASAVVDADGNLLVAVPGRHAIDVVDQRTKQVKRTITGQITPEVVLDAGGHVLLLDRLRSALFDVDPAGGSVDTGQRAGDGATNAVTDHYGRALVTDTRTGELLVFTGGPVLMRQRYPVSGAPFAIAVDDRHDMAWVTATASNQVIGYDIAGGQPVEKFRFATVRQPNSVAVDPDSGRVVVASASGGGFQVIRP